MSQPRESSRCQKYFRHLNSVGRTTVHIGVRRRSGRGSIRDCHRKLSVSGTQVQTTAAYSPWQKGRVEQRIASIKEVAGTTILQHLVTGESATSAHRRRSRVSGSRSGIDRQTAGPTKELGSRDDTREGLSVRSAPCGRDYQIRILNQRAGRLGFRPANLRRTDGTW